MKDPIAWFASHRVAANLLMLGIVAGGLLTLPTITREVFPDITPEILTVRGPAQLTQLCTLLSEASLARHAAVEGELLEEVGSLVHCYWIAAGGHLRAPELAALPGGATLVEEERE